MAEQPAGIEKTRKHPAVNPGLLLHQYAEKGASSADFCSILIIYFSMTTSASGAFFLTEAIPFIHLARVV